MLLKSVSLHTTTKEGHDACITCRHWEYKAPGKPGVEEHHGVIGPAILVEPEKDVHA